MISLLLTMFISITIDSAAIPVKDTIYEIDPIIVVGQREPSRLSKIVNSAVTLNNHKLGLNIQDNIIEHFTTANASVSLSGVNANGYGLGTYGQGRILIRGLGFSPNRGTLVLIDGRPDIAGLFGHPLSDTYRRAGLYSAEMIKGAASTLYGSNAVAGVLNLTSFYRPDLDQYTNLSLTAGSFNTRDISIQHSRQIGNIIGAGWYEYLESDNQRKNSEYFNRSGGFRIQMNQKSGFDIFASGQYSSFDFTDPGPDYKPAHNTGDIQRSGLTIGIDRPGKTFSLSTRFYSSYGEHAFSDGFNSIDRNNGCDIFLRKRFLSDSSQYTISGGVSLNYLGGSAYNGTSFIKSGNFHEFEYAGHMQAEVDLGKILMATVGGRFVRHERYEDHFVYQTGLVLSPGDIGSIKLSIATAYRNPTVSESQLFAISNKDSLKPEDGIFYEIGYFKPIGINFSLESAVFWREGDNLIGTAQNPSPPPMVRYVNTGSYSHSGWETAIRYKTGKISIAPSFIHLNQTNYNLTVPENRFVIDLGWEKERIYLALDGSASFKTHSDSSGVVKILDNYFVVNADAALKISTALKLQARLENIFDADYQVVFGYPLPGFNFRFALAYQIF